MSGHQDVWRTEPDGVLAAEVGRYRLVVQAPEHPGGSVRFLVLRRDGAEGALALIGSGNETDLRTAMKAAARMADRLTEQPRLQPAI
jgi:hypothetical protein